MNRRLYYEFIKFTNHVNVKLVSKECQLLGLLSDSDVINSIVTTQSNNGYFMLTDKSHILRLFLSP